MRIPRGWSSWRHVSLAMARAAFELLYIPGGDGQLGLATYCVHHLLISGMGIYALADVLLTTQPLALMRRGAKACSMANGAQKLSSNSSLPFTSEASSAGTV